MIEKRVLNRIIKQVESEENDSPGRLLLEELRERQYQLELQNIQLKEAQIEIERSRDMYASLYDYSPVGMVTLNREGYIKNINFTCSQLLGFDGSQIIGKPFSIFLHKNGFPEFMSYLKKCSSSEVCSNELMLNAKDNKEITVQIFSTLVSEYISGEQVIHCTVIDITEKKESEELIKKSLKEKSILLKEVHHRVKNNLQIISSLLNLQSNFMKSEELFEILLTSRNRVRAMALVHDKLYKTNNLSEINIEDYIKDLSRNLFESYSAQQKKISLNMDVKNILINVDMGITVGLIVNELITNSVKYAFKGRDKGEIDISLDNDDKGLHILMIKDNGVGIPENVNPRSSDSLGFQLVFSLIEQLKGSLEINRENGTEFKIQF